MRVRITVRVRVRIRGRGRVRGKGRVRGALLARGRALLLRVARLVEVGLGHHDDTLNGDEHLERHMAEGWKGAYSRAPSASV